MQPLPINCEANYYPHFLERAEADSLFKEIVGQYDVTNRVIKMADGREHTTETGVYMFSDAELTSFDVLPAVWGGRSAWPNSLAKIRDRIEKETGVRFQVARCVYYQNGSEGMGFHSDPPAYGPTDAIASISLGAEREFVLRSLDNEEDRLSITLNSGSLLFMGEHCQERYQHGLPHCERCTEPRLNLTFRKFGWD